MKIHYNQPKIMKCRSAKALIPNNAIPFIFLKKNPPPIENKIEGITITGKNPPTRNKELKFGKMRENKQQRVASIKLGRDKLNRRKRKKARSKLAWLFT